MGYNRMTKAKHYILANSWLREMGLMILNSSFVANNPVYKYIYQKQINRVIKKYSKRPQIVMIELTNVCNLHCKNCPNEKMKRERGFIDMGVYQKIIDDCAEIGVSDIFLCGVGEPTRHKSLVGMVAYAKMKGIETVTLYSNATLLTLQLSKKLIKSRLDILKVSIDAATNETYSKMRSPGKLDTVDNNLRGFLKLRNEMGLATPEVWAKFMKMTENAGDLRLFKKKWRHLVDKIFVSFIHNWAGAISSEKSDWQGNPNRGPCTMVFRFMGVLWDGRVSLCCADSEGEVILGDAKDTSIKDIWSGAKIQGIRQAHLAGDFCSMPLCYKCSLRDVWWLH